MRKKKEWLYYAIGCVLVLLFGIWLAPTICGGFPLFLSRFIERMQNPFKFSYCEKTIPCALVLICIYFFCIFVYETNKPRKKSREEHGSARFGDIRKIQKKYRQEPMEKNKIFTKNFQMGYNTHIHKRNMNTIVIGGSGSGKTRSFVMPNIMQGENSMVILDPKAEILKSTGNLLLKEGYEVSVLDLLNMEKSDHYNPFAYLDTDNDVQRLVTNLFHATNPQKGASGGDPFWDTAASMLLMALILLIRDRAIPEEKNFATVLMLLRNAGVNEDKPKEKSILDEEFDDLEQISPDHIALKYYRNYRSGAGKTLKSIQITLVSRLEKFNLESLEKMTSFDDMHLENLGKKKKAIFAIIPDNDTSFNFLVSILYTQLFQQLFSLADRQENGRVPIPVHFLLDEFANVCAPSDFEKLLAVMRSRDISVSIILQNMSQLKALYPHDWESIVGNCDSLVYLGGNEQSTHKYISDALGKATIDVYSHNKSDGMRGSFSTGEQVCGRELLTPDEVRMLDNKNAILIIRGEYPIIDEKYPLLSHKNVKFTTHGGGEIYQRESRKEDFKVILLEGEEKENEVTVCIATNDEEKEENV